MTDTAPTRHPIPDLDPVAEIGSLVRWAQANGVTPEIAVRINQAADDLATLIARLEDEIDGLEEEVFDLKSQLEDEDDDLGGAFARLTAPCADCGVNTLDMDGGREWYIVHDAVWAVAWGGSVPTDPARGVYLCVGCLEKRLGRELTADDFDRSLPINNDPYKDTPRLAARRRREEDRPKRHPGRSHEHHLRDAGQEKPTPRA